MTEEIHPAPREFFPIEFERDPILKFFHYEHLPERLRFVSQDFCGLALHIVSTVPQNAERSVALRKLLEAKDAAVRAMI